MCRSEHVPFPLIIKPSRFVTACTRRLQEGVGVFRITGGCPSHYAWGYPIVQVWSRSCCWVPLVLSLVLYEGYPLDKIGDTQSRPADTTRQDRDTPRQDQGAPPGQDRGYPSSQNRPRE